MNKRGSKPSFILLLLIISLFCGCISSEQEEVDLEGLSVQIVNDLDNGDYDAVYEHFTDLMKDSLSLQDLKDLWGGLIKDYGDIAGVTDVESYVEGGYDIVNVTINYASGASFDFKFVYDDDNKLAGLWISPVEGGYEYPPYADTESFYEVDVTIGTDPWALPGTLSIPYGEGPFSAVVLVHGSGPNDRDETIASNKPFKDLASGLATKGIAVLRYDKRTLVYGAEIAVKYINEFTIMEETVYDAIAAVNLLKGHQSIDSKNIFIIGHSLGATVAPMIADLDEDVSGIVMLAGTARALEDLIVEQTIYLANLDGVVTAEENANIAQIEELVQKIKEMDFDEEEVILGASRAYWESLASYDQVEIAKGLEIPILILQGERDYQVTMIDFDIWSVELDGMDKVTMISYPGLNHLFILGTGQPNPNEYYIPGHVAQVVIEDISEWLMEI